MTDLKTIDICILETVAGGIACRATPRRPGEGPEMSSVEARGRDVRGWLRQEGGYSVAPQFWGPNAMQQCRAWRAGTLDVQGTPTADEIRAARP